MTDKEKFRQTFSVLHASPDTIAEVMAMTESRKTNHGYTRRLAVTLLVACLILALGISAYASGAIHRAFGWGGNMEIISKPEEGVSEVCIHTNNMTDPVRIENGKMYFTVNGEDLDITDRVGNGKAFEYTYEDEEHNTHYWILGLIEESLESYAYGEYMKDPDGNWIGGYSARVNVQPDGSTIDWLDIAKEKLNCPW